MPLLVGVILWDEEDDGTLLQYSCLENPTDGGAWWAAVHGVAKSQVWLSDFTFTFHFPALEKEMATHSSVLAWRIPGMGEPGWLLSMGSHRVGHDWSDLAQHSIWAWYWLGKGKLPCRDHPPAVQLEGCAALLRRAKPRVHCAKGAVSRFARFLIFFQSYSSPRSYCEEGKVTTVLAGRVSVPVRLVNL